MDWTNFAWHAGALIFLVWVVAHVFRANRRLRSLEEGLVPLLLRAQVFRGTDSRGAEGLSAVDRGCLVRSCRFLLEEVMRSVPGRSLAQVVVPAVRQSVSSGAESESSRGSDAVRLDWTHVGPALARLYELLEVGSNGLSVAVQGHSGMPTPAGQRARIDGFVLGADQQKAVAAPEALLWLRRGTGGSAAIKCALEVGERGEIIWRLTAV